MSERLPDLLDPFEFAERKRRIAGRLPLTGMDRLLEELLESQGEASIDLSFGREGRLPVVTGWVKADLILQCQVCLEPLHWSTQSEVRLGIVGSIDEERQLPDSLEPLLVNPGEQITLVDLVQDELLLTLPVIPRHPNCRLNQPGVAEATTRRPFAGLADLQKKLSQE